MLRSSPIANEPEFQEWLASALEAERERFCEAAAARIPAVHEFSFEVSTEKQNEGSPGTAAAISNASPVFREK
jgi:hypothetical protein